LHNQIVFITNFTQLSELKPKTFNSCENEVAKGKVSTSHQLSITRTYTMNISYPFVILNAALKPNTVKSFDAVVTNIFSCSAI